MLYGVRSTVTFEFLVKHILKSVVPEVPVPATSTEDIELPLVIVTPASPVDPLIGAKDGDPPIVTPVFSLIVANPFPLSVDADIDLSLISPKFVTVL